MKLLAALGIAGLTLATAPPQDPSNPAEALARRIEQRHRSVTDLSAKFTQTYRSGILGREVEERGTVAIKPPGRMLWEYRDPERKTFLSDGRNFYFYVPADRQVVVREQAGDRGLLGRLLSGRGGILGQFDVGLESVPDGRPRLLLTPKQPDPDVERIYIEADRSDRIQVIELVDTQGNRSRFRFEAMRENLGLPEGMFHFEVPRGVEVIAG